MSRQREEAALTNIRGILHMVQGVKRKAPPPDLLEKIQAMAIDARDVIQIQDKDEQRFWNACVAFGLSAETKTRKVQGIDKQFIRPTDPIGYNWALCEMFRLLPHMLNLTNQK